MENCLFSNFFILRNSKMVSLFYFNYFIFIILMHFIKISHSLVVYYVILSSDNKAARSFHFINGFLRCKVLFSLKQCYSPCHSEVYIVLVFIFISILLVVRGVSLHLHIMEFESCHDYIQSLSEPLEFVHSIIFMFEERYYHAYTPEELRKSLSQV